MNDSAIIPSLRPSENSTSSPSSCRRANMIGCTIRRNDSPRRFTSIVAESTRKGISSLTILIVEICAAAGARFILRFVSAQATKTVELIVEELPGRRPPDCRKKG
jgi:hypothetical protein